MQLPGLLSYVESAKPLLDRCASTEVAAVAVRTSAGWQLLRGRLLAMPWRGPAGGSLAIEVGSVLALRACHGPGALRSILDGLAHLEFRVPGWDRGSVPILPLSNAGSQPHEYSNRFFEREDARRDHGIDWAAHAYGVMTTYAAENDAALEIARRALPSTSPPHTDVEDLLRTLGFHATDHRSTWRDARVELAAPIPARISMVRRVGDEIHVEVECVGMTKARIVVALIPEEGTLEDRQIRRVEPLVDAPDTLVSCVATFRAPRVRGPAHVVLSYDGVACDQVLTGTPDSRAAVHQLYDTDMRFLQECLTPGKSQRDRIEEGLALLLHLLGFSAACYGYGKFNPSPDVVAFCDDGRALVCECSWTPPDPDMITKARQRADDVRNTLRALGADARVIPVVVTAASPESNPEASLSPRAQGVATLAREDVDRWIALARHGESRERFWNTMENLARPLDRWEREL